jgi:proline iminopeptidase
MRRLCCYIFLLLLVSGCRSQPAGNGKISHIYHREFGTGDPILLINGGPGMNSEGFATLANLLAEKHRVILFDQRGTGRSKMDTVNEHTITMDAMVNDMEDLRRQLQLKNWIVMGHSFGGMLASYYASQHPEQVKALILSSSGGIDLDLLGYVNSSINNRLTQQEYDSLQYWAAKINGGDTSYHARISRTRALASAYLEKKEFIPVIAERLLQGNRQINELVFANMRKIKFDCSKELQSFHHPVLIIQGNQDIVKKETALKAKAVMPQADTVFIDKCSHYGWLEQKEIYVGSLLAFFYKIIL